MKYIGEGYYYRVYELDAGRVLKKLQSYWFSFKKIYALERERGGATFFRAVISAHQSVRKEKKALLVMRDKLLRVPPSLFANPSFIGRTLHYTQDKITVLGDLFAENNLEQNKRVIDGYIELQKKLWAYGLHDKTYKLQTNYGIDKKGGVVCMDFGEFVFTKDETLRSIAKQKWLSRGSYKDWEDVDLKKYYTERMAATMTKENLGAAWTRATTD